MDAENRAATGEIVSHSDECTNCSWVVSDRVRELFKDASANHDMADVLLTNEELARFTFDFEHEPIPDHMAIVYHQSHSLWRNVYFHAIRHTDLTVEEKAFVYCLRYMLMAEAWYSQIVDRVCYLLMWRTNPPTLGSLKDRYKEGHTVNDLQHYNLKAKTKYLTENGFEYLATACDVELRNAAAHMTLVIDGSAHHSATDEQMRNGFSMDGVDIHIKRRAKDGTYVTEKVDVVAANTRLEGEIMRYAVAFAACKKMC